MLTIWGKQAGRFCDGISRREFIKIGSATGLLSLAGAMRAQALASPSKAPPAARPNKSVIMVYLLGGPSQIDTWDLKPHAPLEYRGEYQPIRSNVSGIEICELFPKQAAMMDKFAIIRSLSATSPNNHSDAEVMTGYTEAVNPRARHPCFGAVVSKLRGASSRGVPPYVAMRKLTFPTKSPLPQSLYYQDAGFLGSAHGPFMPTGGGMDDLQLSADVDRGRFAQRQGLLANFDRMRRELDASGAMAGLDAFQEQAFGVLTSSKLRDALDLDKEDQRLVERYSIDGGQTNYGFAADYKIGTQLLLARRLIEAGVGFVEVALGYWDTHGPSHILGFPHMRNKLCPTLDQALTALVEDLHQRGMEKDVVVVVWGEFGRSPRINKDAGRDHWLPAMSALVTGGGLKTGQVIGSTDARGEYPVDRPYKIANVLSTIYRTIGIDPATQFTDSFGRPVAILDEREPVRELL